MTEQRERITIGGEARRTFLGNLAGEMVTHAFAGVLFMFGLLYVHHLIAFDWRLWILAFVVYMAILFRPLYRAERRRTNTEASEER